jgi:hypothetical protein
MITRFYRYFPRKTNDFGAWYKISSKGETFDLVTYRCDYFLGGETHLSKLTNI